MEKNRQSLAMASWHEQDGRVLHRAPLLAIIKAYVLDARVLANPRFFLSFFAVIPIGERSHLRYFFSLVALARSKLRFLNFRQIR